MLLALPPRPCLRERRPDVPNGDHPDAVADVAAALRRYLDAHPEACDTLQWIAAWWLPPRHAAIATAVVRTAVELLVASGHMQAAHGPDGQTVYRAAQAAHRR